MFASVVTLDANGMTFLVFASCNIKDLVVGPVDELTVLVLEDLEPF